MKKKSLPHAPSRYESRQIRGLVDRAMEVEVGEGADREGWRIEARLEAQASDTEGSNLVVARSLGDVSTWVRVNLDGTSNFLIRATHDVITGRYETSSHQSLDVFVMDGVFRVNRTMGFSPARTALEAAVQIDQEPLEQGREEQLAALRAMTSMPVI